MKKILIIFTISILLSNKLPNDVRWVVESNEFKALCNQVYNSASTYLDEKFSKNKNSLNIIDKSNLAIVMDLDETVLDNSQYQVELFEKSETFNMTSWADWVRKEDAKLVPGSKEFIEKIRNRGYQIIFISNRMDERLEETKNNMKKLNIFSPKDIYLLRKNKQDKKIIRRNEIYNQTGRMAQYEKFNVILYMGDAYGDFPKTDLNAFGFNYFIFPNPMYGKW